MPQRSTDRYGPDVLAPGRAASVPVPVEAGLVVEDATTGFCGAVVAWERQDVVLEDRRGARRAFPLGPGFLLEGRPVVLTRPRPAAARSSRPARSASGSVAVPGLRAQVARASRIFVEGRHDAELVERIWGHDLRVEGVVVEYLEGVDDLPAVVARFRPGPGRRLGVLVDHVVPGSKESRLAADVMAGPHGGHVLVVGHPFVDVWQSVRPAVLGIPAWPEVPRGTPWKEGVIAALGWDVEPARAWQRILAGVSTFADLEPQLLGRVEELIDFVTAPG